MTCLLCQRRQPETGYACAPCLDRLAAELRAIQDEAALLSAVPSMAQPTGTRGGTLASHRSPARLDAITLTDPRTRPDWDDECRSVLGILGSWARAVREDRALTSPRHVTVASERKLLSNHLEWLAAQPYVDEFAAEVRGLLGQLRRANGTHADRPLMRCVVPFPDGLCGGNVWLRDTVGVVWHVRHDRCDAVTTTVPDGPAVCDACGTTWATPAEKARLNAMIHETHAEMTRPRSEDGQPWLTAQELVDAGLVTSVSNVRVQAHRRGVRAVGAYYDPAWFEKVSA